MAWWTSITMCIGCKACMQACPYDAIYMDPHLNTAAKCNFCSHRVDEGLLPSCVAVCPQEALLLGDLEDPMSRVRRSSSFSLRSQPDIPRRCRDSVRRVTFGRVHCSCRTLLSHALHALHALLAGVGVVIVAAAASGVTSRPADAFVAALLVTGALALADVLKTHKTTNAVAAATRSPAASRLGCFG